jgi:hypothetical protein
MTRSLGATAALAAAGAILIGGGPAPGDSRDAAVKRITAAGVGQVELGRTHRSLRAAGLVGRLRRGCELGGPNTREARLKAPLEGFVTYSLRAPRRAREITVSGGAEARGVGVGATIPQIRSAFPEARVVRETEEVFGVTLVQVPKRGGGKLSFAVDVDTRKVTLIGIPGIAFCE